MVALCPNNNEVHIYKKTSSGFEKQTELKEHDQVVTGIDWGHKTNRIVTCSQDRNAYVWKDEEGTWKPTLVILRINRAATQVKWSPNEDKFAVASGSKVVSVCYFEADNDWWVSKHIKKHKSTVTCVAWHPNNVLLATGCSDFKVRIFSAWVKGVDAKGLTTAFGDKLPFGELFKEYDNGSGWVHSVDWSPSGNRLVFVAHDASISFCNDVTGAPNKILLPSLPLRTVNFINEDTVVACGHDCCPLLFGFEGGKWTPKGSVDKGDTAASGPSKTGTQAAMAMFKSQATTGTSSNETTLPTKHQNAISCTTVRGAKGFSTTGVDGRIIEWSL
jgi:actin related protein 2/3 complex subunit 1A/1B